ncbi:hypothetical protein [Poseidonocella sedimentorum]|uniref:Uncharacterized protein n=1 Tax=Poseidonocella sedimentorum TaxID=871652 RepID=A0A1I6E5Y4_9RHOB|nr:hypothetical protein [Poseidonocella sedimentorum]SFR12918.1 hypothetical protein SAMN04515673_107139 [Poseidonocella sedimentorum]
MTRVLTLLAILGLGALPGCTRFPALDRAVSPDVAARAYPGLLPLDVALGEATAPSDAGEITEDLSTRRAGLEARAAALAGPVIDGPTRRRMAQGIPPIPPDDP